MKTKKLDLKELTIPDLERVIQNTEQELRAEGHTVLTKMKIPYYNNGGFAGYITYIDKNDN